MSQVATGSFTGGIESFARTRFCRMAPRPPLPPSPIRRRRRWAAARVLDQVVPCWASPARRPRSRPTSTATRHPACCPSCTLVMAGTLPICSYCAPSAPLGCWTSPRSYPAITRSGVSRTGRYLPRTPAIKTSNSTSRKRSISSVSAALLFRLFQVFSLFFLYFERAEKRFKSFRFKRKTVIFRTIALSIVHRILFYALPSSMHLPKNNGLFVQNLIE